MESPQWSSSTAKYILVAGGILFALGINPFQRRTGDEIWLTDIVKAGPEIFAGITAVQALFLISGISLALYSFYHERAST